MNLVEQAYSDIEARKAEVRGAAPAGSLRTREEMEKDAPESASSSPAPVTVGPPAKPEKLAALADTRDFAAFFAADIRPAPLRFKIDGRDAILYLRPLDAEDAATHDRIGLQHTVHTNEKTGETEVLLTGFDREERHRFLVTHTVVGGFTWRKVQVTNPGPGEEDFIWQQEQVPAEERQRRAYIEQTFRTTREVWSWLVEECLRVNGLAGETPGN